MRVQVKCYLQMSGVMSGPELQEALDIIETTNLKYFTKEMVAEFMALKGSFFAHTGRWAERGIGEEGRGGEGKEEGREEGRGEER